MNETPEKAANIRVMHRQIYDAWAVEKDGEVIALYKTLRAAKKRLQREQAQGVLTR